MDKKKIGCIWLSAGYTQFFLFVLFQFAVQNPGQTVYVSAESWPIGKHTVKPSQMAACRAHHHADVYHRKQCAYADNVPLSCAEEYVAEYDGKYHKSRINANLHFRKFNSGDGTYCYWEAFARHCHRAAAHLKSNA